VVDNKRVGLQSVGLQVSTEFLIYSEAWQLRGGGCWWGRPAMAMTDDASENHKPGTSADDVVALDRQYLRLCFPITVETASTTISKFGAPSDLR
jgi:hypothetical protein